MSLTKRWFEAERDAQLAEEKKTCGCKFNYDDKFEELCEKHAEEEKAADFWGAPIDVYTDEDAQDDGILIDVSGLGVKFNGKYINRVTCGVSALLELSGKDSAIIKNRLRFIAGNSTKDRQGSDAWGTFEPHAQLGGEKLWLVGNEIGGYTLMLPEEY